MSNTVRTFEPETGDFSTEPEINEVEIESGVDYLGDGNADKDGWARPDSRRQWRQRQPVSV